MDGDNKQYGELIKERFARLPEVVRNAITSADVEKQLRALAESHKLHLDQWETLESQVMLTLMGIESSDDLEQNIKRTLGVQEDEAAALAGDISKIVFEPIREELERQLDNPDAKEANASGVEQVRAQTLAQEHATAVAPATPPAPAPEEKAVRTQISEAYKAGEASTARKDVHNDPYREPPA